MINRILIIVIVLFFSVTAEQITAQESRKPSSLAIKRLEAINQQFTQMEWDRAMEGIRKLTNRYSEWKEAWLLKAAIAEEMELENEEYEALERVVQIDSQYCYHCLLRLAEMEYKAGRYAEASGFLNRHHQIHREQVNENEQEVRLALNITFALDQVTRSGQRGIARLGDRINTEADEYFPSLTIDGVILAFTRQEWIQENEKRIPGQEDLYQVRMDSGVDANPESFPAPVNTEENEGTMSMSQDGRIILFTSCGRKDSKGSCDLYISRKSGSEWLPPKNLGYPVNTRYWESTPFLAPDSRTLYFSSNRPGGIGGTDLWYSCLNEDGSWQEPVNLGSPVNTPGNEMSPFILPDGQFLFFSSDGHIGMGGMDLYRSQSNENSGWDEPLNLGYPINTHYDEEALTMPGRAYFAIFSSNRSDLGGKDLYRFTPSDSIRPTRSVIVRGTVKNRLTGEPLRAAIEISATEASSTSRVESDDRTGEFLMGMPVSRLYRVNVTAPGFLLHSDQIDGDTLSRYQVIEKEFFLEPIQVGSSIVLRNVFFETDSFALLPSSKGELDELVMLVRQNPRMIIEIGGHTDSTGSPEYNQELSQKRAESVRTYLIANGIAFDRLSVKGYGDTRPMASNETPEGRSLNRRTEIKVLRIE